MKINKNPKNAVILTTILALLLLAGCSSAKTEDGKEDPTATAQTEVNEVEQEAEVETVVEEVAEVESTEEAGKSVAVVPEGVDLESDLSGKEWIESFIEKVDEPLVIVFNDNTGRKEVIQQDSEVTINPDEDMIAVYFPIVGMAARRDGFATESGERGKHYELCKLDSEITRSVGKIPTKITITGGDDGDVVYNFTIIAE